MESRIPLQGMGDVYLIATNAREGAYPSTRIQKGLVLTYGGADLSEEGIGFGVPVLKFGYEAVFPGSWITSFEKYDGRTVLTADFEINLVGRISRSKEPIESAFFNRAKEGLASIHRDYPLLRNKLTFASELLKGAFGLEDVFEEIPAMGKARVVYTVRGCVIDIDLNIHKVDGCTEVIVLNEQGANHFDLYQDSDGLSLLGDSIGCWEETVADEASLKGLSNGIVFSLKKAEGTRMFRGRELLPGRLAWSGLAYLLPPEADTFSYSITVGRT